MFNNLRNNGHGCADIDQSTIPELTIYINVHFINGVDNSFYPGNIDDNGVWNGNNAAKRAIETFLNGIYMPNMLPHPNSAQPAKLGDSKIRFALYTEEDNTEDLYGGIWYHETNPTNDDFVYDNVLNIVVYSEDPNNGGGPSATASSCVQGTICKITVLTWGSEIVDDPSDSHSEVLARRILHELGHITGLCHSFAPNQQCTDIITSIECGGTAEDGGESSCGGNPNPSCMAFSANSNNIMGEGGETRSLTPCQWAIYYGALYIERPDFVHVADQECDFTSPESGTPYVISTGEHIVFDNLSYMPNDIIIHANASLRISCVLMMAPGTSITVKRAGKLIVDGGSIIKAGDAPWKGIYVEGNGSKEQPNPSLSNPNYTDISVAGSAIFNFATISGAQTAVRTRHRTQWWLEEYWGGLIAAQSTNFLDNGRAIEFMKYEIYGDDFPNESLLPNKSIFDECTFKEVEEHDYNENTLGVTIWACNGIEFKSCTFENLDQTAIYGINCGFKVSNNTGTNVQQSTFKDNLRNIEVFSTYSNRSNNIIIEDARFDSSTGNGLNPNAIHHITVEASSELFDMSVQGCTFYKGQTGIVIEGPAGYTIVDNTFDRVSRPLKLKGTGKSPNEVRCNRFYNYPNLAIGISHNNSGLLMRYNDFITYAGLFEMILNGTPENPGSINALQGGENDPARNCFDRDVAISVSSIPGNTIPFKYVVHTGLAPFFDGCILIPKDNLTYPIGIGGHNYYLNELMIPTPQIIDIDCTHTPPGDIKPDEDEPCNDPDKDPYYEYKDRLAYYQEVLGIGGSLTDEEQKVFYSLQQEFDKEKIAILRAYQRCGRFSDMEAFLLEQDTEQNKRWLLGVYFQEEDWDKAQQMIDQLPMVTENQQNYHDAMVINLAALQQNYIYELSSAEETALYDMAYSDTPSRAYARSILALLKQAHFEPDEDEVEIQPLEISNNTTTQPTLSVRYYPNPTKKFVYINLSAKEVEQKASFQIMDIEGKQVLLSGFLNDMLTKVDLSTLHSGVFILQLKIGTSINETHKLIQL